MPFVSGQTGRWFLTQTRLSLFLQGSSPRAFALNKREIFVSRENDGMLVSS